MEDYFWGFLLQILFLLVQCDRMPSPDRIWYMRWRVSEHSSFLFRADVMLFVDFAGSFANGVLPFLRYSYPASRNLASCRCRKPAVRGPEPRWTSMYNNNYSGCCHSSCIDTLIKTTTKRKVKWSCPTHRWDDTRTQMLTQDERDVISGRRRRIDTRHVSVETAT